MPLLVLLPSLPFYLHFLIELPASINFFLNPSAQIPHPHPPPPTSSITSTPTSSLPLNPSNPAEPLIRQYAILLFSSALISLVFALRPIDNTSHQVAAALALYHVAPLLRAGARLRGGEIGTGLRKKGKKGLGGPVVHFVLHGVCLLGLGGLSIGFWDGE